MTNETILIVDDEVNVLSSLSRSLFEEDFGEIFTAKNGTDALEIIQGKTIPNVIISDYHMPGINGIELLVKVREIAPDTTRILLTGAADMDMAINAVNKGSVFRFLMKPCSSDVFIQAVKDGLRLNQLILSERDLLTKTLNGSIKVMIDILEAQSPFIFTQSTRLRKLARNLGNSLGLDEQLWEIELAALLSQIGAVTIPQELLFNNFKGKELSDTEREMINSIPRMGRQLLLNIPRFEVVAEAVGDQNCTYLTKFDANSPNGKDIPVISRILKIIMDYDRYRSNLHSSVAAISAMKSKESEYDPQIWSVFCLEVLKIDEQLAYYATKPNIGEKQIYVDDLKTGMVLARDVVDRNGILIVAKETIVTEVLLYKLINYFRSQALVRPIFIETDL
jgi:response regulator RpfG family c-di-GMP phosphodiesterase